MNIDIKNKKKSVLVDFFLFLIYNIFVNKKNLVINYVLCNEDEPNIGYLWGVYTNPKKLATSSFELAKSGVYAVEIVEYNNSNEVKNDIEV